MELQLPVSEPDPAGGAPRRRGPFRRREGPGTARVRLGRRDHVPRQGQGDAWALSVRRDFPLLSRRIGGRRIVYLDSAATSQKPDAVIEAMSVFYRSCNANIHRSVYTLAAEATALFEGARARIAAFAGGTPDTTIFTRNATEAVNLVARIASLTTGWALDLLPVRVASIRQPCAVLHLEAVRSALTNDLASERDDKS